MVEWAGAYEEFAGELVARWATCAALIEDSRALLAKIDATFPGHQPTSTTT